MTTYDANQLCSVKGRKFFFDTNVWININGFDPRPEFRIYSDFYKSLLEEGNSVVVSDLVVSEFHNRCCKTQHKICLESGVTSEQNIKRFRNLPEASDFMNSVRDTCLNLLEDCEIDQLDLKAMDLPEIIEVCAKGKLDYNDLVILKLCAARDYILVTHDRDFQNCGVEVATANRKFLKQVNA